VGKRREGKLSTFVKIYDREQKGLEWELKTHQASWMYTEEKPADSNIRKRRLIFYIV